MKRRATVVIVVAVVAVALAGGAALYLERAHVGRPAPASGEVTSATELSAGRGAVVFADDFQDPSSGWNAAVLPSGSSFGYAGGGYLIAGKARSTTSPRLPFAPGSRSWGCR